MRKLDPAKFGRFAHKVRNSDLDRETIARAVKVHALFTKGATPGERSAAEARLMAIAAKHNLTLRELRQECGLPSS